MEHILKPGDACAECEQLGLTKKLRYFHISLEEQILKCESDSCLYPHCAEISSDEEEDAAIFVAPEQIEDADDADGDALIADLLKDSNFADVPTQYDFSNLQMPDLTDTIEAYAEPQHAAPTTLSAIEVETKADKPLIEIQSIQTFQIGPILTENSTKPVEPSDMKIENPQQTKIDPPTSSGGEEEIPKARISRYFTNLIITKGRPKKSTKHNRQRQRDPKKEPTNIPSIRTDDVLKLLSQKKSM